MKLFIAEIRSRRSIIVSFTYVTSSAKMRPGIPINRSRPLLPRPKYSGVANLALDAASLGAILHVGTVVNCIAFDLRIGSLAQQRVRMKR